MKETSKKKRLINFIIDVFTILLLLETTLYLEVFWGAERFWGILRLALVFGGYYIPLEYLFGKTVGKYFTNSEVVNYDGSKISIKTATIRFLCRWIPLEFTSLALGYDSKAWHDTISKTYVIDSETCDTSQILDKF
ncbi:RDD family protein [Aureispira sp. CCB-QB1]|uniref:RDD family protein n=1 Tax=Aureispira sp. CCB-QB1 TaxID=1313421 RepID=UPI000696BB6D|nr:RDD family protein [Aureispira sp. CCB-QB1]